MIETTFTNLKHSAVAAYEDLVWRLADPTSGDPSMVAEPQECGAICWAAEKTIEQLQQDVAATRRRVELQPQIEESKAAAAERERLITDRAKLEAEFEAIREQHEAQVAEINGELGTVDARWKSTSEARRHYRASAPQWLRDRLASVEHRLYTIHRALDRKPPNPPGDPNKSLMIRASIDSEERSRLLAAHDSDVQRHKAAIEQFDIRREKMLLEQEELKREQDALHRAERLLRPTAEDVK